MRKCLFVLTRTSCKYAEYLQGPITVIMLTRELWEIFMPEQKNGQSDSTENEAGGLKAGRGIDKGNPRPRQRPTVSTVPAFTKLRHRV